MPVNIDINNDNDSYTNRLRHQSQRVDNSRKLFDLVFNRVFNNVTNDQRDIMYFNIDSKIHHETCEEYNDKISVGMSSPDYSIWADIITKKYDHWRAVIEDICLEKL